MIHVWIMSGCYEGEQFASTHLTEIGCVRNAIADVLEYLGVEDEETARDVMYRCSPINADTPEEVIEWDQAKMQTLDKNTLYGILGEWSEYTWDTPYDSSIIRTQVKG